VSKELEWRQKWRQNLANSSQSLSSDGKHPAILLAQPKRQTSL
jgi:hypothetical protein